MGGEGFRVLYTSQFLIDWMQVEKTGSPREHVLVQADSHQAYQHRTQITHIATQPRQRTKFWILTFLHQEIDFFFFFFSIFLLEFGDFDGIFNIYQYFLLRHNILNKIKNSLITPNKGLQKRWSVFVNYKNIEFIFNLV